MTKTRELTDEQRIEIAALVEQGRAWSAAILEHLERRPSPRMANGRDHVEHALVSFQKEIADGSPIVSQPTVITREVVVVKAVPKLRWPNDSAEQSARGLFEKGQISEHTPEAFREWQRQRQAEMAQGGRIRDTSGGQREKLNGNG